MRQDFKGFCGPTYASENKYAAVERCVNYYPEANESQEEGKYKIQLLPSPCNQPFSTNPTPAPFNARNRGQVQYQPVGGQEQVFGVNGQICWSMDSTGTMYSLSAAGGPIADDGKMCSFAPNANNQILLCGGGVCYLILVGATAAASTMGVIPTVQGNAPATDLFGASMVTFQDNYGIALTPNSHQFQISGTDDNPTGNMFYWQADNVSIQAGQADLLRAIISQREYLRLLGDRRSQIYQNVGAAGIGGFPFQSFNETFIETGISAPFSLADMGDSLIWIGKDARGVRACWRDFAFQPQRISNFAVEQFWQNYPTIDDAVVFPFIWNGHLQYQVTFPPAPGFNGATWVYDATVSQLIGRATWHERTYTDSQGITHGRSEISHVFAFGKHLVASGGTDGNPGMVYQYTDKTTQQANPMLLLRWSNDGGFTWSFEQQIPTGAVGQFGTRVFFTRMGYGRDRVFWTRVSDLGDWGLNADLATFGPQAIVRDRVTPHLYQGNQRVIYHRIEFELRRAAASGDGAVPGIGLVAAELDFTACAS